jgi:DNA-binding GntR family transcriptional regulator
MEMTMTDTVRRSSSRPRGESANRSKLKRNSQPINAQIFTTLRQRIIAGKYAKTGRLTTELALMSEFKVSRHTIRTALQKLASDGLIERRRGAQTVISQRDPPERTWAVGSLDKMLGKFYASDELFVGSVSAKRHPDMARLFGVDKDKSLFQVIRILKSAAGPLSYSKTFTRMEFGSRVPRKLIPSQFLLTLLERYCKLRAVRARQVSSAAVAPGPVRRALGLKESDPVLVLQRTFFTRSGQPIEHVHVYCRPDVYPQIVEFYRDDEIAGVQSTSPQRKAAGRTLS